MLVVVFHTSSEAFAFEKACKRQGIPGRLSVIPRALSAGCGLAWKTTPDAQEAIESMVKHEHLPLEGIHYLD